MNQQRAALEQLLMVSIKESYSSQSGVLVSSIVNSLAISSQAQVEVACLQRLLHTYENQEMTFQKLDMAKLLASVPTVGVRQDLRETHQTPRLSSPSQVIFI